MAHNSDAFQETSLPPESIHFTAATFGARLMALFIDLAILGCLYIFLLLSVGIQVVQLLPFALPAFIHASIIYFLFFLLSPPLLTMTYFTIFHGWRGQTIGKMLMGIQVVSNTNGLVSLGKAFLRWVGYLVSALPVAAGFLWSVVDKAHCAWHDKLAGTHVIVANPNNL